MLCTGDIYSPLSLSPPLHFLPLLFLPSPSSLSLLPPSPHHSFPLSISSTGGKVLRHTELNTDIVTWARLLNKAAPTVMTAETASPAPLDAKSADSRKAKMSTPSIDESPPPSPLTSQSGGSTPKSFVTSPTRMSPGFELHSGAREEVPFASSQQRRKSSPHFTGDGVPVNGLPPPDPFEPLEPQEHMTLDFITATDQIIPPPPEFSGEERRSSYPSARYPFAQLDEINVRMRSPERLGVSDRREVRTSDLFPSDLDLTDGQESSPEPRSSQHVLGQQVGWEA